MSHHLTDTEEARRNNQPITRFEMIDGELIESIEASGDECGEGAKSGSLHAALPPLFCSCQRHRACIARRKRERRKARGDADFSSIGRCEITRMPDTERSVNLAFHDHSDDVCLQELASNIV